MGNGRAKSDDPYLDDIPHPHSPNSVLGLQTEEERFCKVIDIFHAHRVVRTFH